MISLQKQPRNTLFIAANKLSLLLLREESHQYSSSNNWSQLTSLGFNKHMLDLNTSYANVSGATGGKVT